MLPHENVIQTHNVERPRTTFFNRFEQCFHEPLPPTVPTHLLHFYHIHMYNHFIQIVYRFAALVIKSTTGDTFGEAFTRVKSSFMGVRGCTVEKKRIRSDGRINL